jgi:ankyrin repeat protein
LKKVVAAGFATATRDEAGDSALHAAAAGGAQKSADFLLRHGLQVDVGGAAERTPLMAAVLANQSVMVRWLLRQGADPGTKDKDGFTALMLAARDGKSGAARELAPYQRDRLDAAILLAALVGQTQVIDTLTNYGASVYARMEDGRTPLMVAAENGHAEAVKLLLELGASRLSTDAKDRTAADLASAAGHPEIAALIARDPLPDELTLEPPDEVAKTMDAFVAKAAADTPADNPPATAEPPPPAASSDRKQAPSRPIQGAVVSVAVAAAAPPPQPPADGKPAAAADLTSMPLPPLVMRHYREREMPVEVRTVTGNTATLRLSGASSREVQVRAGATIPGSRLLVVRVQRRMKDSKLNLGQAMEVSVVDVRDPATGATREWISGVPTTAHDPVALIEDAATGQRYTATPGQRFKSADGAEFIISDVRPNQLVIENAATGAVQTLPLRGPRG